MKTRLTLISLVLLGALFRVIGASGSLWLDEIWSLDLVGAIGSPLEILTALHIDNNHPLCSFMFYVLGAHRPSLVYRALPFLASVATLALVPRIAGRLDLPARVIPTALIAASFPLVVITTEARGYAFALFFQCAALLVWRGLNGPRSSGAAAFFFALLTLGCLSHFSTVGFALALALVGFFEKPRPDELRRASATYQAVIVVIAIFFWMYFVKNLPPGTGFQLSLVEVVLNAASSSVGGPLLSAASPERGAAALMLGVLALLFLILELALMFREKRHAAVLLTVLVFVVPAIVVACFRPRVVFERYFLTQIFWGTIVIGCFLKRLARSTPAGEVLAALLTMLAVAGGVLHAADLRTFGRGDARTLVSLMAELTKQGDRVGSNQDFRAALVLGYHFAELPPERRREIVPDSWDDESGRILTSGNELFVLQEHDTAFVPAAALYAVDGGFYEFEAWFPYAGLSGSHWVLYRRGGS